MSHFMITALKSASSRRESMGCFQQKNSIAKFHVPDDRPHEDLFRFGGQQNFDQLSFDRKVEVNLIGIR